MLGDFRGECRVIVEPWDVETHEGSGAAFECGSVRMKAADRGVPNESTRHCAQRHASGRGKGRASERGNSLMEACCRKLVNA